MATGTRSRALLLSATVAIALAALLVFQITGAERSNARGGDAIENARAMQSEGVPLRIMPLGDPITQADDSHLSYRYYLWILLTDAGVNFDFVGSMNGNYRGDPEWPIHKGRSFDSDHEGHWGWSAGQILDGFPQSPDENLSGWLKGYTPDIALVHLGTNDVLRFESAADTIDELKQIIGTLRDDNPSVIILLAKLIPVPEGLVSRHMDDLNDRIEDIGAEMSGPISPVIIVDQTAGFDSDVDLYDGLHPNESGERKMAAKWFEALQERPSISAEN
jgi:hypothetical protein